MGTGKKVAAALTALVVVGAVAVGGVELRAHAHRPAGPPSAAVTLGTTTVTRTDLSDTQTLAGTLGFGTATPVTGRGDGTVTGLPGTGAVVGRGEALYRVDDQPVVLLLGDTPLFRTLSTAPPAPPTDPDAPPVPPAPPGPLQGRDVSVVADNLVALGYDIGHRKAGTADGTTVWTKALAAAVKRWQKDVGMTATGTLGVGQVVVLPDAVRVDSVQARLGDPAAEPVLSVTATTKTVTVPVNPTNLTGIVVGAQVGVTLPDSTEVPATVTAISQTVHTPVDGQGGSPTLDVSVVPVDGAAVAQLDSAPVRVTFTTTTRTGVLVVPVTALLALSGGGYALQRPDGSLLAVQTGLFAHGDVEVSGAGLEAGATVVSAP